MNVNFGFFPLLEEKAPKKQKRELYARRSMEALSVFQSKDRDLFASET